jgi:uncharacterized OsmC-like protein
MPQTTVSISTVHNSSLAVGWAGNRTLTIDRKKEAGGMGLGYSGGELLLLAIGACYTNDLYREAARRNLRVRSVQVEVQADWGGEPVRAQNVSFSARVEAEATEQEILKLIEDTDRVAEIHNSLRLGTPIRLAAANAVPAGSGPRS